MTTEDTLHERRWWALAVLCLSLMVIGLDNTILNVALPSLIKDLGASTSQLQWIIDGYVLVFAGLLLTSGSLGDRFGRRGALTIGLSIFGIGSLVCSMASSATALIFTRAFMGIGAALIMPATLSLLINVFTEPKERGRAIGIWAAVVGAGSALGPLVGGFLLQHFWWGSVFLINVPVVIFAIVLGRFLLPTSKDPSAPRLDPVGAVLSVIGLVALLWGIIEAPSKGWTDPSVAGGFIVGFIVLSLFITWELHTDHPMLDIRFFKNPRFTVANAAMTLIFFAMFGSMFLVTQYLQNVLGYSALQAGIRMLPMAGLMVIVGPRAPRLVERIGTKLVVTLGLVLSTVGLLGLAMISSSSGYPQVLVAMTIMSIGIGLTMGPATESIMGSLPKEKAGIGSAMNDTTREVGGALGVAIIGSVLAASYRPAMDAATANMDLPPQVAAAARDSVGGAVDAATSMGGQAGQALADAAHTAFLHAFSGSLFLAAGVVALAAILAFVYLPAHAGDAREDAHSPLDGIAPMIFASGEGVLEMDAAAALTDQEARARRADGGELVGDHRGGSAS
ncbi:MAG: DHA2 family efflux MFS transporter permease subunit [Acidimicrobiales bacterium]